MFQWQIAKSAQIPCLQSEAVQQEALAAVTKVLTSKFPDRFQLQRGVLTNVATGESWSLHEAGRSPMEVVARLVQVPSPHLPVCT